MIKKNDKIKILAIYLIFTILFSNIFSIYANTSNADINIASSSNSSYINDMYTPSNAEKKENVSTDSNAEINMDDVNYVIDLIFRLPSPEEIENKIIEYEEEENWTAYEKYSYYIAKLAKPAYEEYMKLSDEQKELVTNINWLMDSSWLWSVVDLSIDISSESVIYSGQDLYNLMSLTKSSTNSNIATANKTKVEIDNAEIISLTAGNYSIDTNGNITESAGSVADPFVWIDFYKDLNMQTNNKYVLVTYWRANELYVDDEKMQLFAVSSTDHTGASEINSTFNSIITDGKYHYNIFDLTKYTDQITSIRFDYIDRFDEEGYDSSSQTTHRDVKGFSIDIDCIAFCNTLEEANEIAQNRRPDIALNSDLKTIDDELIDFKLFNYSNNINKNSELTNWREISKYFLFSNSTGKIESSSVLFENAEIPSYGKNSDHDKDGFYAEHSTVERNLSETGYPILDLTRNADGTVRKNDNGNDLEKDELLSKEERNLGYLFGETEDHAVTAYDPKNTILQYDEEKGMYIYDSKKNAVDYNIEEGKFYLRNYTERSDRTSGFVNEKGEFAYYDFLPFNYTKGLSIDSSNKYQIKADDVDFWFGTKMKMNFFQEKNGEYKDEDMIFTFNGDDDIWIFIDNVLVLDLGGTHGSVTGTINFATGEIKQYLNFNGVVCKTEGDRCYSTTLYECYNLAYKDQGLSEDEIDKKLNEKFKLKDGNFIFKDFSTHEFDLFYLERGAGVTTCNLYFNMPVIPENSLMITKKIKQEELNLNISDQYFVFKIDGVDVAGNDKDFIKTVTISVDDLLNSVDEDGYVFSTVAIELPAGYAYNIAEVSSGIYKLKELQTTSSSVSINDNIATVDLTNKDFPEVIFINEGEVSKGFSGTALAINKIG